MTARLDKACLGAGEKWGISLQVLMLAEESTELATASLKFFRRPPEESLDHMAEEIADVQLMMRQISLTFNLHSDIKRWKKRKLERLEERLKEAQA
jgi:NTP pyrophosphatase (non-canonical NTP hydrolase)